MKLWVEIGLLGIWSQHDMKEKYSRKGDVFMIRLLIFDIG